MSSLSTLPGSQGRASNNKLSLLSRLVVIVQLQLYCGVCYLYAVLNGFLGTMKQILSWATYYTTDEVSCT